VTRVEEEDDNTSGSSRVKVTTSPLAVRTVSLAAR
jgi:hypothetical protein